MIEFFKRILSPCRDGIVVAEYCPECGDELPCGYDENDVNCGVVYECFNCDWAD